MVTTKDVFGQPDDLPGTQPDRDRIQRAGSAALERIRAAADSSWTAAAGHLLAERSGLVPLALLRLLDLLGEVNNLLLAPLFTLIAVEIAVGGLPGMMTSQVATLNYLFCASFLTEWAIGLHLARQRSAYLTNLWLFGDVVSSIPLTYLFQTLRLARLGRLLRFAKLLKLIRARRFSFPIGRLLRAIGVSLSVAVAGALALEALEPETVSSFEDALWWSLVTITTVGYGDIIPVSAGGRAVAVILMTAGIGIFGYLAGLMSAAIFDPEEDFIINSVVRVEGKVDRLIEALEAQQGHTDVVAPRGPGGEAHEET